MVVLQESIATTNTTRVEGLTRSIHRVVATIPLEGEAALAGATAKLSAKETREAASLAELAELAPAEPSRPSSASTAPGAEPLDADALLRSMLDLDAAERARLAAELLRSLDPDDLKALLQSLRRFPWEEDAEAQTEHSGDLGAPMDLRAHTPEQLMEKLVEHPDTQEHHLKATAEAVLATDPVEGDYGETAHVPRKKRLTPASEKRGLTSIMKALKNKKQKAQGLKSTEREGAIPPSFHLI